MTSNYVVRLKTRSVQLKGDFCRTDLSEGSCLDIGPRLRMALKIFSLDVPCVRQSNTGQACWRGLPRMLSVLLSGCTDADGGSQLGGRVPDYCWTDLNLSAAARAPKYYNSNELVDMARCTRQKCLQNPIDFNSFDFAQCRAHRKPYRMAARVCCLISYYFWCRYNVMILKQFQT